MGNATNAEEIQNIFMTLLSMYILTMANLALLELQVGMHQFACGVQ